MGISCTDGVITSFTHFGVYAKNSDAENLDICATGLNVDTGIQGCDVLSSQESTLYKEKLLPCIGEASCFVEELIKAMPTRTQRLDYDEQCTVSNTTVLFMQYECRVSEERVSLKRLIGSYSGCLSAFSVFYLMALTRFIRKNVENQKEIYDLETVTVSDYTLWCHITNDVLEGGELIEVDTSSDPESNLPVLSTFKQADSIGLS